MSCVGGLSTRTTRKGVHERTREKTAVGEKKKAYERRAGQPRESLTTRGRKRKREKRIKKRGKRVTLKECRLNAWQVFLSHDR